MKNTYRSGNLKVVILHSPTSIVVEDNSFAFVANYESNEIFVSLDVFIVALYKLGNYKS